MSPFGGRRRVISAAAILVVLAACASVQWFDYSSIYGTTTTTASELSAIDVHSELKLSGGGSVQETKDRSQQINQSAVESAQTTTPSISRRKNKGASNNISPPTNTVPQGIVKPSNGATNHTGLPVNRTVSVKEKLMTVTPKENTTIVEEKPKKTASRSKPSIGATNQTVLLANRTFFKEKLVTVTPTKNTTIIEGKPKKLRIATTKASYMYNPDNSTFEVPSQKTLQDQNLTCNCMVPKVRPNWCCSRVFYFTHKMGHVLGYQLFHDAGFGFGRKIRRAAHGFRQVKDTSTLISRDYRDVILVRNIYSAIVSGYLYHKSGKECWLDHMGQPTGQETADIKAKWDTRYTDPSYKPNPPSYGRDLCQYMASVDEPSGMRAYMEWVFHVHYRGLVNQWRFSQMPNHRGRTLFVCNQQLTDPAQDESTLHDLLQYFFPAGDAPTSTARTASETPYEGPHATIHNDTLRSHLKDVIRKVDREQFHGAVKFFDSILPC